MKLVTRNRVDLTLVKVGSSDHWRNLLLDDLPRKTFGSFNEANFVTNDPIYTRNYW